jgi:hypothetical protein
MKRRGNGPSNTIAASIPVSFFPVALGLISSSFWAGFCLAMKQRCAHFSRLPERDNLQPIKVCVDFVDQNVRNVKL